MFSKKVLKTIPVSYTHLSAARKSQPSAATVNQDMPVVNHKINRTPQQVSPTMKKEDDSIKIPEFIQNYRKKED